MRAAVLEWSSVIRCFDEITPGVYQPNNVFLFLQLDGSGDSDIFTEAVFGHELMRRHEYVAVLDEAEIFETIGTGRVSQVFVVVARYNIYLARTEMSMLSVYDDHGFIYLLDLFPTFAMQVVTC